MCRLLVASSHRKTATQWRASAISIHEVEQSIIDDDCSAMNRVLLNNEIAA